MSKKSKTLKEMQAQLDEVLNWFESEDFDLESAVEKYKQAAELMSEIEQKLDSLKKELADVEVVFEESA